MSSRLPPEASTKGVPTPAIGSESLTSSSSTSLMNPIGPMRRKGVNILSDSTSLKVNRVPADEAPPCGIAFILIPLPAKKA